MPPRTLKKMSEHYKAINKGNQKTILFFIIVPMTYRQDRQKKEEEKRMRLGKKRENTFAPKSHVEKIELDGPLPHRTTEKQLCNEAESSDLCIPRYTVSIVLTHC